jgi:hypothetical protein
MSPRAAPDSPGAASGAPLRAPSPFWTANRVVGAILFAWAMATYGRFCVVEANALKHGNDFKHIYLGARLLAEGQSPYDRQALLEGARLMRLGGVNPYVYLPFTGQVLYPLTFLNVDGASNAWFWLNHAFLWGGFALLAMSTPGVRPSAALLGLGALFCFASWSGYRSFTAGQLNHALFFLYALVWWLLARGRDATAGGVAAFAALFKIAPGFLVFYFLFARRWRALAGMVGAGLILVVAGMIPTGVDVWLQFVPLARDMGFGSSTWGDQFAFYKDPTNQSLNSLFHHLFASDGRTAAWMELGPAWANRLTTACALAILGASLALAWRRGARSPKDGGAATAFHPESLRERALYGAFVMGSLLIPSLCWDHYAVIATTALLLLLWAPETRRRPWLVAALCAIGWTWSLLWPFQLERYNAWWALGLEWHFHLPRGLPKEEFPWVASNRGAGLLLQSLKLWPSLAMFGICAALAWKETPTEDSVHG